MRTIIGFSLNNDSNSALRNRLLSILKTAGLGRVGTGTYEGHVQEAKLQSVLGEFWGAILTHRGDAHLDHFFMWVGDPPSR